MAMADHRLHGLSAAVAALVLLLGGCLSDGGKGSRRAERAAEIMAEATPRQAVRLQRSAVEEVDPGYRARREHLLRALAGPWLQPFPNFANAPMHYYATLLAQLELADDPMAVPAAGDGDRTALRAPLFWGVLKYDGESMPPVAEADATAGTDPAQPDGLPDAEMGAPPPLPPRGTGRHMSFSWEPNLFHFNFPGLAALLGLYPDLPVWDEPHHREPGTTYRAHYLRYVLNRRDNFNAFTGEGTENHINMSRPSGWVCAREAQRLGLRFADAPYSAAVRAASMKDWMRAWAKRIYSVGIGEWDADIYHAVSIQGWLVAYDYAGTEHGWDPEVRLIARAVLDYYAATLALKHIDFHNGAASMRGLRQVDDLHSGTNYLAYLWFGDGDAPMPGTFNGHAAGEVVYAAISDYRPPVAAVALARKFRSGGTPIPPGGETYFGRKASYLLQDPAHGSEVVHLGPNFILGSANLQVGGFSAGTWQIVPWRLAVAAGPGQAFPSVFTGNGGFYGLDLANSRDPWMQLVQHRQVLLQLHRVPEDAPAHLRAVEEKFLEWRDRWLEDFRERWQVPNFSGFAGERIGETRYPHGLLIRQGDLQRARTGYLRYPEDADVVEAGSIVFLRVRSTYLAVRAIHGAQPVHQPQLRTIADVAPFGQLGGLVIEVGSEPEHGGFIAFQQAIRAKSRLDLSERDSALAVSYTALSGDRIRAVYGTSGRWREPDYDWNFGVRTRGGVSLMHGAPWQQPAWPSGEGQGRQPAWSVNGVPVDPGIWPVIDGPRLKLDRGRLTFRVNGERVYMVDFSGDLPAFFPN